MSSPFKVIKGTDSKLAEFEKAVSTALLEGYELATDLVTHSAADGSGIIFFQAMINDEGIDFEEEDEDEDEDE